MNETTTSTKSFPNHISTIRRPPQWMQMKNDQQPTTTPTTASKEKGTREKNKSETNATEQNSSKGKIWPTPHLQWTVKGIYYSKGRREHKNKICVSIFQQNRMETCSKNPPYYNRKMQSYFVKNGLKQPMDDDLFGLMSSLLEREQARSLSSCSSTSSEQEPTASWRVRDDRTYDNRPNDPDYFKTYYQRRVKQPVECKYCGMMISDTSNLSKHGKTKSCMNGRKPKSESSGRF